MEVGSKGATKGAFRKIRESISSIQNKGTWYKETRIKI
jgi:hypothetical protein